MKRNLTDFIFFSSKKLNNIESGFNDKKSAAFIPENFHTSRKIFASTMPEKPDHFFSDTSGKGSEMVNRAFKYGDGVFETLCLRMGKINSAEQHWERMNRGAEILGLEWKKTEAMERLDNLIVKAGNPPYARIRMQLFRAGNGNYLPESNEAEWIAELVTHVEDPFAHGQEVSLCIWNRMRIPFTLLSGIKHCNRIPSVLAALHAKKNGFDDAVIPGAYGFAEASGSNFFLVKNGQLVTPGIETGCLNGIMRQRIIGLAKTVSIKVSETVVEKEDILSCDELFLCNAFRAMIPAKRFLDKSFPGAKGEITLILRQALLNEIIQ